MFSPAGVGAAERRIIAYAGFFADRWDTSAVFLALIPVAVLTAAVGLALLALARRAPPTGIEMGVREPPISL